MFIITTVLTQYHSTSIFITPFHSDTRQFLDSIAIAVLTLKKICFASRTLADDAGRPPQAGTQSERAGAGWT